MTSPFHRSSDHSRAWTVYDLLNLPPEQRRILNWMQRQHQFSLADLTKFTGQSAEQAQALAEDFLKEGLIQSAGSSGGIPCYQIILSSTHSQRRRAPNSGLFNALIDDA